MGAPVQGHTPMRAGCTCTAPVMVRGGRVVCATCGAAVLTTATSTGYSSVDLPPDCRTRRQFAMVCRSGVVGGAELRGRVWSCPAQAWRDARVRRRPPMLRLVETTSSDAEAAREALAAAGVGRQR